MDGERGEMEEGKGERTKKGEVEGHFGGSRWVEENIYVGVWKPEGWKVGRHIDQLMGR